MDGPPGAALRRARWWPGPGLDAAALSALVECTAAALDAGRARPLKRERRKQLHALALGGTDDVLLKTSAYGRGVPWLRRARRSRARRELARAIEIAARGIPTPLPLAAGELRRGGLLERAWLLVPCVPGAVDLGVLWRTEAGGAAERRAWTAALGALARRMHDAGIEQDDFAPNNFLWRPDGEPRLLAIDFERALLRRRLAGPARARMLAKLERHLGGASTAARWRFVLAYAGGERGAARRAWRAVEVELPALVRRDLAHWRRTATRPGRRFTRFAAGDFAGPARREAPAAAIAEALAAGTDAPALWAEPLGTLAPADAASAWTAAQVLWLRRLAPLPLALARAPDGASWLVSARATGARRAAEAPHAKLAPALAVAIDRLLAYGARGDALAREHFALVPGPRDGWRAELLQPPPLDAEPPPGAERPRRARALAAKLLDAG